MVGECNSSTDLAKSDKGGTIAPSIPLGSCEPLKNVRGTSPFVISGATASEAKEVVSLVSNAHRERHVMSNPADSLSKPEAGDTTRRIYAGADVSRRCARSQGPWVLALVPHSTTRYLESLYRTMYIKRGCNTNQ